MEAAFATSPDDALAQWTMSDAESRLQGPVRDFAISILEWLATCSFTLLQELPDYYGGLHDAPEFRSIVNKRMDTA